MCEIEWTTIWVCKSCHRRVDTALAYSKKICAYCGWRADFTKDLVEIVSVRANMTIEFGDVYVEQPYESERNPGELNLEPRDWLYTISTCSVMFTVCGLFWWGVVVFLLWIAGY